MVTRPNTGERWGEMLPRRAEAECRRISDEMTRQAQERAKTKQLQPLHHAYLDPEYGKGEN